MGMFHVEKKQDVFETYVIANAAEDTYIEVIPERGGMIANYVVKGKPVFYLDKSTLVDKSKPVRGGNPILFPICGRLVDNQYSLDGENDFTMGIHGFARDLPWTVTNVTVGEGDFSSDSASMTLELLDNENTYLQYPFRFKYTIEYRLTGMSLSVKAFIVNRGEEPMPVGAGYHPYFYIKDLNSVRIEIPSSSVHGQARGSIAANLFSYEQDEINIIYQNLQSNTFEIEDSARKLNVTVHFEEIYQYLVVWSLKGRSFICVEPWMAAPNALNTLEDVVYIGPGEVLSSEISFKVETRFLGGDR